MSTRTGTSFFHVDGHRRHFGRSTGTLTNFTLSYFPCPTYFFGIAERHFGMSTGTFTIFYYSLCPTCFLASRGNHFGMSTGSFWHVDGHFYYFRLYYSPLPTNCLASQGIILACRRAHLLFYTLLFSLSNQYFGIAGPRRRAHVLFRTLLLFPASLLFGIAGRHFGMSTG